MPADMARWGRIVRTAASAAAAVFAFACAVPAHALASADETSIIMDDTQLIYASPDHVAQELEQMASLGIDQVKVSMVWGLVSPDPFSTTRPNFDATNPADYPPGAWDRYDTVVRLANELGMSVYFQLTAPPPDWAVPAHPKAQPYRWHPSVQDPNPKEFGQFVEAVGRRYSGTYVANPPPDDPPPNVLTIPIGGLPVTTKLGLPSGLSVRLPKALIGTPGSSETYQPDVIPRVSEWGIWNEPNLGTWLNPQYIRRRHHRIQLVAPLLYRQLVDNAWNGLVASGHQNDTILIGETASGGIEEPLELLKALYCVNRSNRPLTGSSASALGCPVNGSRSTFVAEHPGLFRFTGYAHHPYSFDRPPTRPEPDGQITLANLNTLENELNRLLTLDGQGRPGGVPIYLTEFGYKSNPPNPFVKTSLTQQATWLNEGEYMSWQYPYVRALAQFLLVDNPPKAGNPPGTLSYWSTFQSGLIMLNGRLKPAYAAYRLPIWVPNPRHGPRVTVWGQLRPADHSALQYGIIEFQRKGSATWQQLTEVETASAQGFLLSHVAVPSAGSLRLAWLDQAGVVEYSRTVPIT
jgi:hypothetical protein